MSIARVIEIDERTAGILVPETPGRFRFFSSDRLFDRLEGRFFRTAGEASAPPGRSSNATPASDAASRGDGAPQPARGFRPWHPSEPEHRMSRPRIVAFAGSLHRPSRTRALLEAIGAEVARGLHADLRVFDLVDAGPGLAGSFDRATLTLPARRIVDAIESADALIVGSPVYKGSYTGLFKHVFDLVEPDRLAGKPVVLAARAAGRGTRSSSSTR